MRTGCASCCATLGGHLHHGQPRNHGCCGRPGGNGGQQSARRAVVNVITAAVAFTLLEHPIGNSWQRCPCQPAVAGPASRPDQLARHRRLRRANRAAEHSTCQVSGLSVSIYPAPRKPRMTTRALALCPNPAGVRIPARSGGRRANCSRRAGPGLSGDLRVSDGQPPSLQAAGNSAIAATTFARTPSSSRVRFR